MKKELKKYKEDLIRQWRDTDRWKKFLENISSIDLIDQFTFSASVLFTEDIEPKAFLKNLTSFDIEIEDSKEDTVVYRVKNYVGRANEKRLEGIIIAFKIEANLAIAFSISSSEALRSCINRAISKSYPVLYSPIYKQKQLKNILIQVDKQIGDQRALLIERTSAKRWDTEISQKGKKKTVKSRVDYGTLSIKKAFTEAKEEGKWFTKISFRIYNKKNSGLEKTKLKANLSNKGQLKTDNWIQPYSNVVLPKLISISKEKLEITTHRSRQETKEHRIRPLEVKFEDNIFDEDNINNEFIATLKNIKNFGYSVIHSNPYIHMSLLDYKNGSSFEILVERPDRFVILPQIKSDYISFEKILSHINNNFREIHMEGTK